MKRIGVVIPIYNTEKYLRQCIESVLAQKYENMAIALVDDGSIDNCGKICDEYAKNDNRITVIHQDNQGMLASRYNGAQILDCDYLTFVDSDDFIAPNTYETFTEQIKQGIDVISWQIIRYYNKNNQRIVRHNFPCKFYNNEEYKNEILPYIIWIFEKNDCGIDPAVWNKLIKKDLMLEALQSTQIINISYGEDRAIIYPLLKNAKTLYLSDKNLYYHRQRGFGEIPPYFEDKNFFQKLYILYDYLLKYFGNDPKYILQLDAYFAFAVNFRNSYFYNGVNKIKTCIFPFSEVPPNKNIILYGAGINGKIYYNQLTSLNYAKKILWVDKNYLQYNEINVKNIECLKNVTDYDYLVIAIEDEGISKNVIEYLNKIPALSKTKIIWNISKF